MPDDVIQSIIDAVPDPMVHIGRDGTIAHANGAAAGVLGDWIIGRNHGAALRQPTLQSRIEAVLDGASFAEARYEQSEQTGVTEYKVRLTGLGDGLNQSRQALMLHFTDISHLREAQEVRRDFIANVSHELKTPLTSVLGFIETLRGSARDDASARERFLGIMADEARRMDRLVSDLLSLNRVEAEERVRPSEAIDLIILLRGVIAALRPRAEISDNELILAADEGQRATVMGDRDQLTQVFMNLTENAMKYGGAGKPVKLALKAGEGRGLMRGATWEVSVIDRGPGIASQHLPRLTERFYRVDAHRSREMGGTGLGLAIVKHIVSRHRGRLRITSEEGHGATFSVHLLAHTADEKPEAHSVPEP